MIDVHVAYRRPSAPNFLGSESTLAAMLSHVMYDFANYDLVLLRDFNLPAI
jgi:hypothetical protein